VDDRDHELHGREYTAGPEAIRRHPDRAFD
jgi:hypothetical protein